MTCCVVETYQVPEPDLPAYRALMKGIHQTLNAHRREIPELLSYRTFTAGDVDSGARFVELFEFATDEDRDRFFAKLGEADWLRALADRFHRIVPECPSVRWAGFLAEEWLVR